MKLSSEQATWFDNMRREWNEIIVPNASPLGRHVFDVGPNLSDASITNARVYSSRISALSDLPQNGVVAELGTQAGWFAEHILANRKPRELHLFDLEFDTLASARPSVSNHGSVTLHLGDSSQALAKLPDGYFDWIYIDGDHSLAGVKRDADVAVNKIKKNGILVFNDYTVWSVLECSDYGIVPVVNELLAGPEWEMVYIALHPLMYCDVAIRRREVAPRTSRFLRWARSRIVQLRGQYLPDGR